MQATQQEIDEKLLSIYEDIAGLIKEAEKLPNYEESSSYYCRLEAIRVKVATERRIIEELSAPCRFLLEHFSLFLGRWDYSVGVQYGQIQSGRSVLTDIRVGEWGKVSLCIGNLEVTWRDADYQYLFYPDKVILRPNQQGKGDIYLYFSYAFKYGNLLSQFADQVKDHEQTAYWHQELTENE